MRRLSTSLICKTNNTPNPKLKLVNQEIKEGPISLINQQRRRSWEKRKEGKREEEKAENEEEG